MSPQKASAVGASHESLVEVIPVPVHCQDQGPLPVTVGAMLVVVQRLVVGAVATGVPSADPQTPLIGLSSTHNAFVPPPEPLQFHLQLLLSSTEFASVPTEQVLRNCGTEQEPLTIAGGGGAATVTFAHAPQLFSSLTTDPSLMTPPPALDVLSAQTRTE